MAIGQLAQLWAADGQFLGVLSSNQSEEYSISNLHGIYGSSSGAYSIRNSKGLYGSMDSKYSPYNYECLNPPLVFYQEQPILVLSKNLDMKKQVNGLKVIDPDLLLAAYLQIPITVLTSESARKYEFVVN